MVIRPASQLRHVLLLRHRSVNDVERVHATLDSFGAYHGRLSTVVNEHEWYPRRSSHAQPNAPYPLT
jgi:hypothetical protein